MPNDAKFGLVGGVGLVIIVAVVFFHRELTPPRPEQAPTAVNAVSRPVPQPAPRMQYKQSQARTMTRLAQAGEPVAIEAPVYNPAK